MTIAFLESRSQDIVTSAGDNSNPDDESSTDAIELLPLEAERLAYGDAYTTDATPFQSRIGAQVSGVRCVFSALDFVNSLFLCRPHSTMKTITQSIIATEEKIVHVDISCPLLPQRSI